MALGRIPGFLRKSWPERYQTARFFFRQSLSKLPYFPVRVRFDVSSEEHIQFWWSQVLPYFDEKRGLFDYWGQDVGDLRFLWRILKPGMVFMDIGAYHGIYSVVAGKKLQGNGTVVAFEPSPREYRRLRMHLRWNGISYARAESLALGATVARTKFFQVASGDTTRNGLRPPDSDDSVTEISVDTVSLDQYVASHALERVDVIKLDVEGGEIEVLRGAGAVLAKFRPVLICEVLDATTHTWGYEAREIIAALREQGYDWFDLNEDGSLAPHEMRSEYTRVKNYLAIPHEKCGSKGMACSG
jgi:FkbM family methyltransferase